MGVLNLLLLNIEVALLLGFVVLILVVGQTEGIGVFAEMGGFVFFASPREDGSVLVYGARSHSAGHSHTLRLLGVGRPSFYEHMEQVDNLVPCLLGSFLPLQVLDRTLQFSTRHHLSEL